MIRIRKVADDLYSADEFGLPPWVKPSWATSAPMRTDQLVSELLARGYYQTDIRNAFYEADPDWPEKGIEALQ